MEKEKSEQLYFDGFCPESLIIGKQVEMRLNEDDFWESLETKLQIAVFPPYATILRWRGEGKIKKSSQNASDVLTGLVFAQAMREKGKEIFPDTNEIINDEFSLEWYLDEIYESKQEFDDSKFNPDDPIINEQQVYLTNLTKQDLKTVFDLFNKVANVGTHTELWRRNEYSDFHKALYNSKLIFAFNWSSWDLGRANLVSDFDFSQSSLLELSMYITTIFRQDRFCDGFIDQMFRNGIINKIMEALINNFSKNKEQ